jgi:hypothetical protein
VKLRRVFLADGSGYAALGMARIAVIDAAFGDQEHAAMLLRQKPAVEPGDAAADYYIIKVGDRMLLKGKFLN